jgi:hypothetical protein
MNGLMGNLIGICYRIFLPAIILSINILTALIAIFHIKIK